MYGSKDARVGGVIAVVTHHEVTLRRDMTGAARSWPLRALRPRHLEIGFGQPLAVNVDSAASEAQLFAWKPNYSLDEMLGRVEGIGQQNDIAAVQVFPIQTIAHQHIVTVDQIRRHCGAHDMHHPRLLIAGPDADRGECQENWRPDQDYRDAGATRHL